MPEGKLKPKAWINSDNNVISHSVYLKYKDNPFWKDAVPLYTRAEGVKCEHCGKPAIKEFCEECERFARERTNNG